MSDLRLEIEERNGEILLRLGDEDCYMPPDQAIQVAKSILDHAGSAQYGGETLAKNTAVETIRKILIPRVIKIIKSLQEQQKSPEFVASEVVDRVIVELI